MAILFPENPNFVNTSEKLVFEKLTNLSDSWHIYSNIQQHITLFEKVSRGEIDFILTHPHLGIVLLEVKGYGVFFENNTWHRTESDNIGRSYTKKIKSPYKQIEQARGNMLDFLHQNESVLSNVIKVGKDWSKLSIHTFVVFPYLPDFENLGMESEENNTITQLDLENISNYFHKHISNKKFGELKGMQDLFKEVVAPTVNTAPLRGLTKNIEKQLMSSTQEQSTILNAVLENNSKIFVTGPAGSGKTVLAVEAAKAAAEAGKKVLFLCYNQKLSRFLKSLLEERLNINVYSLFGFFAEIDINLKDVGTSNLSPKESAPIIAKLMDDNFDKFQIDFDVLIIDEAQDFSPLFWPTFELLAENKKWYIFADKRQAITHNDWSLPSLNEENWLTFPLTKYLRSTKEISEKVLDVYDDDYISTSVSGHQPEFKEIESGKWSEALDKLSMELHNLLEDEKYHPKQIQILIPHSRYLEDVEQAKYSPNKKIGGIKDINIESIYKFKGLESEVVVMIVPNITSLESETTSDIKSLMYVGMSRATALLTIIGDKEVKELANWNS